MLSIFIDTAQQFFESLLFFTQTSRRVYWPYLAASLFVVLLVTWQNKKRLSRIIKVSFSKKYWFNASCYIDYQWMFINQTIKILILVPVLISSFTIALSINRLLIQYVGEGDFLSWPQQSVILLFSVTLFLIDDFTRFFIHFLYHRIPWLWQYHAVHHSATVLTPLTLYRVHSVEFILNNCRGILVTGIVSGIFIYSFSGSIGVVEVLGVNIFNFIFNMAAANLRHSHVYIGFGYLEHIFISPAQHQIHHSRNKIHFDQNFGSCLSIWDKAFKSWRASANTKVSRFGL